MLQSVLEHWGGGTNRFRCLIFAIAAETALRRRSRILVPRPTVVLVFFNLAFELKLSYLLCEGKPAFAFMLLICVESLVVLSEHFCLKEQIKRCCSPLKGCVLLLKIVAQVKNNCVWWWHLLSKAHYLHFFIPCSIRWILLAIFIITELLCVVLPKGPWQLIAAERRYVYKWLGNGQKWNVLLKLHRKLLSWDSVTQQLCPWWPFKKKKKAWNWIPLYSECLDINT